jgi:hypothetical protein
VLLAPDTETVNCVSWPDCKVAVAGDSADIVTELKLSGNGAELEPLQPATAAMIARMKLVRIDRLNPGNLLTIRLASYQKGAGGSAVMLT